MGAISRWFYVIITTVGSEGSLQAQTMSMMTCRPNAAGSGGDRFLISKFLNPYGKLSPVGLFHYTRVLETVRNKQYRTKNTRDRFTRGDPTVQAYDNQSPVP
jgi:hypothetical protein